MLCNLNDFLFSLFLIGVLKYFFDKSELGLLDGMAANTKLSVTTRKSFDA